MVDRLRLALVLLIALAQGALYLCLLPPWQHYDEPTHFEYAWLLANRPGLPQPGDEDQTMRRDLAAAMAQHNFYWNLTPPTLLTNRGRIEVGVTELTHPPAYYLLVSLPLRLVRHLDLVSQLYVARAVSLLLFLATIAIAAALVRELTRPGHDLRWAVPLAIALIPPFADLMTAVNNDVGAALVFALFLWAAVRTIRRGLTWPRGLALAASALLAVATKNTAAPALALAPLAALVAFWAQRGWRWRRLAGGVALVLGLVLPLALGWGDAAGWYRGDTTEPQAEPTRAEVAGAPLGQHALLLDLPAGRSARVLVSPLAGVNIAQLAGRELTVGGWLWAVGAPAELSIGVAYKSSGNEPAIALMQPANAGATPTFVAWTLRVPEQATYLQFQLVAKSATPGARVYADGLVVAQGAFAPGAPPTFDTAEARAGSWGGLRFANLLRNPSAEAGWPRLRAALDGLLVSYIHRSPAQSIAALIDIQRIAPALWPLMVQPAAEGMVGLFAWSNVRLPSPAWGYLARALALLALAGGLRALLRAELAGRRALRPALIFLLLVGLLIWLNTILRPLPLLGEFYVLPAARYTFPAISITALALVGGWRGLWPARFQQIVTFGLLGALVLLNAAAIQTIWMFYRSLPL